MKNSFTRWVMLFQETSTESGRQKSGEQNHQRAEAIDSQMVIDGRQDHPGAQFLKLHAAALGIKLKIDAYGDQECEQGKEERNPAERTMSARARERQ